MANRPSLDDYVDVAERIQDFIAKYPKGSLQQWATPYPITVTGEYIDKQGKKLSANATFVVYTAAAYRTPDDERPGIGTAWEPFPGRTPYTKDSELMNAETAAWGRAIVALGFAASGGIASRQEVQARQEPARPKPPSSAKATTQPKAQADAPKALSAPENAAQTVSAEKLQELRDLRTLAGVDATTLRWKLVSVGVENAGDGKLADVMKALTPEQAEKLGDELQKTVEEK